MSAEQYIQELRREKDVLDSQDFQHAIRLLEKEINNVEVNNNEAYEPPPPQGGQYKEEVIKLSEKIMLPVEEYPRFNFVGKIIGPKGSTMKAIQNISKTRIMVLGRGSSRDRDQELLLSQSDDPKNEHYKEPLHVVINVKAPRSEAHERLANCIEEINKCIQAENEGVYQANVEDRFRMKEDARSHPQGLVDFGGQAPIIKVGIPPPGAIILNGPSQAVINGSPKTFGGRGGARGRGRGRQRPY